MIPRNCNFCGLCCTLTIKVNETEVRRIESLGHSRDDFTEKDDLNNTVLKKNGGWCYFFRRKDGVGFCTIYNDRPKPCRDFPGKPLCDLRDNVIFSDMSNKPKKVKMLWEKAPKKSDTLPKEQPEFPL